jgi:hypothetical protein
MTLWNRANVHPIQAIGLCWNGPSRRNRLDRSVPSTCDIAFKEWAVVCAALGVGRQSLIVRKGGIHEGREGFRVAHREFWLFPTYLHEAESEIVDEARPLLARAIAERPAEGTIHLQHLAVVRDVHEVRDASKLTALAGLHIWSHRTLDQRFYYRTPGVFVLTVRVYRRAEPIVLADSPHFAGCRSWVDLPAAYATEGLQPVLSDAEHEQRREQIRAALEETRLV